MPLAILLIDTNADRARALEEKLSESSPARVVRSDGPDLTTAAGRAHSDLVIIDMALPDRDALEDIKAVSAARPTRWCASLWRRRFWNMPALSCSSTAGKRTAPWVARIGIDYVKKPLVEDNEGRKFLHERFLCSQLFAQIDPWTERSMGADAHEFAVLPGAAWARGELGCDAGLSPSVWWSKAKILAGFAFKLAGWSALKKKVHSEASLRRLLKIPTDAELASFSNPRRAMFRYAGFLDSHLAACVFFGPPAANFAGAGPARALLGRKVSAAARLSLLSGVAPGGAQAPSRTACSCFCIIEAAIHAAITRKGLTSPAEIGETLKAGTNCGSCTLELQTILAKSALAEVT